ncbi:hypothetical protein NBRC3257_3168 [Gluconobacter thailandicus NBRC 3257]|uniref:Uncharacterized protein n=1 Tax=Gluconobacter thailandicus NBRC 3257 TaxID=1381097 RepID=A0ABQ0J150_GLUTH|nr:hypothetical protein AD946_03425 [Gluconobacter thailandicus]GAC88972.1 hypothetical protein NBRC3255_2633 [Gluconobacter thailandicus NBRC 3255]GAD28169.1 hypothetical protein NBRC3257_3168 [Gluconobacter thailandicus NBRC 3257]
MPRTEHRAHAILTRHQGDEPKDPILAAVEAAELLRCFLREDNTFKYVRGGNLLLKYDFARWRSVFTRRASEMRGVIRKNRVDTIKDKQAAGSYCIVRPIGQFHRGAPVVNYDP